MPSEEFNKINNGWSFIDDTIERYVRDKQVNEFMGFITTRSFQDRLKYWRSDFDRVQHIENEAHLVSSLSRWQHSERRAHEGMVRNIPQLYMLGKSHPTGETKVDFHPDTCMEVGYNDRWILMSEYPYYGLPLMLGVAIGFRNKATTNVEALVGFASYDTLPALAHSAIKRDFEGNMDLPRTVIETGCEELSSFFM